MTLVDYIVIGAIAVVFIVLEFRALSKLFDD